jgi:membrane-associated phospholipid phosphatase
MRSLAQAISIVLHPLFIVSYVYLFLMVANPYVFGFSGPKQQGVITISVITISCMFPLIAVLMMKALGMIQSLEMHDKLERIGPLIVTGIFLMWLYINIRRNDTMPEIFNSFVLGATIAVFMSLVINSFTKVSLHTAGAGGLLMGMLLILGDWTDPVVNFANPLGGGLIRMSIAFIIAVILIGVGAVGTARLYLKAHNNQEILLGYMLGILSQLIAYRIYFVYS